ncbi:DNA repair protein RadC [Prevotella aurantiaca]|uniref:RadC family protein n=1 Tax=Prevotella aurantiaca TaxID=596085 RepID=UPI00288A3486|nr:DNA repair protein RadC [Prevotella aurantiaca]
MMEEKKLTITQWAEEDRPREKLMNLGAETLSNAELLAILIGSGSPRESAVELMKRVLSDCKNNLNTLGKLSITDLTSYNGIGEAKAITILAACELGKRRQVADILKRPTLNSANAIYNYMRPKVQDKDVEEAWILLMNQKLDLIEAKCISHGGITGTAIDVRIILKEALLKNATAIALCHNHPSGNPSPSREDDNITTSVKKAADTMCIYFVDHVIVAQQHFYSYREEGKI